MNDMKSNKAKYVMTSLDAASIAEGRRFNTFNKVSFLVAVIFFLLSLGMKPLFVQVETAQNIYLVVNIFVALFLLTSIKIAHQWERIAILRFGRFHKLASPGLFLIIPIVDKISHVIDMRIRTTDFNSESTLTMDNVPVNVDAICFWMVWDAKKSILEVENYYMAIILSAQTALRDIIGTCDLAELLTKRKEVGEKLQQILDEKTNAWGITVQSVEISDITIPKALEDAMSKKAQAERERQARVILGTVEADIAEKFTEAAEKYRSNPEAIHLRGMNMLLEGLKGNSSMVLIPSSALDTMNLGGIAGISSLTKK